METIVVSSVGLIRIDVNLADLLLQEGVVKSKREYDRLAKANAVRVKDVLNEPEYPIEIVTGRIWSATIGDPFIVRVGKTIRKFCIVQPLTQEHI